MAKDKEKMEPAARARRSLLSMIARLGACAYLIYIVVKLVKESMAGVEGVSQPLAVITAVVLGVAAAFFAVITLMQFFRGIKNEDYSMHKYYAEDLAAQGLRMNEYGEYVPLETPEDEGADEEVEGAEEELPDILEPVEYAEDGTEADDADGND